MRENLQKTGSPESQGVPSQAIRRLVEKLQAHHLPIHSLLIARHGVLVAEIYFAPYERDTLHRMYSQTKSFVSLAIGLLIQDGKLKLTDHICDYFPEYLPKEVHPWMQAVTIEHMLTMETCHDRSTFREDDESYNWTESFFVTPPANRPGSVFQYDTSATHVLAALVEKLAGMPLMEFLRSRLLDDIGFSRESYMMRDPYGVTKGGSGLMATSRDMLRVGLMLASGGKHPEDYGMEDAPAIYPEAYLKQALKPRVSTFINPFAEYECGYGYLFWMLPDGAYKMFGMASQDTFCFPREDMVVVTTADTQTVPKGSDILYSDIRTELLEKVTDAPLPENSQAAADFEGWCRTLTLPVVPGYGGETVREQIQGIWYTLEENPGGFEKISISFSAEDSGVITYTVDGEEKKIFFGIGHLEQGAFPGYHWKYAASGAWLEGNVFGVRIWITDYKVSSVHLKFAFLKDGGLTVLMKRTEEVLMPEFQGVLNGKTERKIK